MAKQNIKPRFEVHKIEGKVSYTTYKMKTDDEGKPIGGFEPTTVKEPGGYMVYFPTGASIRVRTEKELIAMGFSKDPELVDMDTGDVVEQPTPVSLKTRSEQLTSRGRNSTPI